jgi:hypothetical protein
MPSESACGAHVGLQNRYTHLKVLVTAHHGCHSDCEVVAG